MAAIPPTISTLRWTARLLLIAAPPMILSGFLTAKPYLFEAVGFGPARTIHTLVAPLVFVPLLVIHSTAGILFLIGRNKRLNRRWFRLGAVGAWVVMLLALSALYFFAQPPETEATEPAAASDAGVDARPAGDAAPSAEAGPRDAGPVPAAATDADRPSTDDAPGDAAADAGPRVPALRLPEKLPRVKRADAAPPAKRPDAGGADAQPEPPTPPVAPASPSGSRLVAERCVSCHPVGTVYATKRTPAEWRGVVARMVKLGARLDDAEREAVIRHLSATVGAAE